MDALLKKLKKYNDEEKSIINASQTDIVKAYYTTQQEFIIESSKFLKDDNLIITRKHPRFIKFPMHKHDYIELNYVFNGQLKQKIGDEEIVLKKGEMLFLNQHIEHSLEKCGEEDIIINFIINPSFFDYIFQELEKEITGEMINKFLFQSLFDNNKDGSYLYFKVSSVESIQKLMEDMILEMMDKNLLTEIKMKFTMGLLFVELMKHTHLLESKEVNYDYRLMNEIINYINDFYPSASLNELADKLNMATYNLSKLIKQNSGKTFKDLVQEKRIDEAKKILKYKNKSVEQVANYVGYDNISYFYRLFKKHTGFTPNRYRNS
jgi:YesN/AraC family two-component response regulator